MSFSIDWLSNPKTNQQRARFELRVSIYEKAVGDAYPVVVHSFLGKTREEAEGYYRAHLKTDTFFRGCVEKEQFDGIDCWTTEKWRML